MNKAQIMTIALTAVAVLIALWLATQIDKGQADTSKRLFHTP